MSEGVDFINKKLSDEYGYGVTIYSRNLALTGAKYTVTGKDISIHKPTFKLVWATNLIELRYGIFDEYTESGDIFLRRVEEVREEIKYPLWPDKWVLEQLLPADGNVYLEKAGVKYSYEPRWVFGNANSDPQPVWKYVKILCDQCLTLDRVIKSPNDLKREEQEAVLKERALAKTIIQNDSPFMSSGATLRNKDGVKGDAIIVPSNYERNVQ